MSIRDEPSDYKAIGLLLDACDLGRRKERTLKQNFVILASE
jgi:hypothetical protein